jgi:hypothetical protein
MQGFTVTDYAANFVGICHGICDGGVYTFSYLVLAFRLHVPLDMCCFAWFCFYFLM